jgi:NitT/TauT family transport system substrate-binding protein
VRGWGLSLVVVLVLACGPTASAPAAAPAEAPVGTAAGAPARDTVKVAYGSTTAIMAPAYAAVTEGFLARYGIDAEISYAQGSRAGVPAVMAGELDVLQTAGPAVFAAQLGGGDIFWPVELTDRLAFSIVSTPDIRRIEDLRGKKLAVTGVGTSTDTAARLLLGRSGLRPGEDVLLVNAGGMAEIVTLLEGGLIESGFTSSPGTTQAKRMGLVELVNLAEMDFPYPFTGLAVRHSWAEGNRDLATRFVAGFMDATAALKTDKALAVRVVAQMLGASDTDLLADDYDHYVRYMRDMPTPSARTVKAALDELAPTSPAAATADPARFVDTSYVEAAAARRR